MCVCGEGLREDTVDWKTDLNARGVKTKDLERVCMPQVGLGRDIFLALHACTKRARIHDFDASRQRNFEGKKNDCFAVV